MSNKIGRFEILSEITHSARGSVYKATDPESGKTVALKTVKLELLGDQAKNLVECVLQEAEASKALNSHNLALLYGAGEMDAVFCASLEYVQGNSVATMLARKEGFSIWDLLDVARQSCQGLDHAHTKNIFHYTLEPEKIMVTWDGTVKVLGFGISQMSAFAAQATGEPPEVLHYMSPEQLRGDSVDARSNLFSLGAILYEMVTERKAFNGNDADQVRQAIVEMTPVPAEQINRKIHPALSEVISKAMSKAPEDRYPSGQELVNDLERCKENATRAAKPNQLPARVPTATKASAPPLSAKPSAPTTPPTDGPFAGKRAETLPAKTAIQTKKVLAPRTEPAKAAAAAAGADSHSGSQSFEFETVDTAHAKSHEPAMSSSPPDLMSFDTMTEAGVETPKIAVDPMMAESPGAASRQSFSEIDELPPLKEVYIAPPANPVPAHETEQTGTAAAVVFHKVEPEKPKIQPREVARKAVTEIRKTPPKMFGYSIAGAVAIILVIVAGIAWHIHSENADEDTPPAQPASTASTPAETPAPPPGPAAPVVAAPTAAAVTPEPQAEEPASVSVKPKYNGRKKRNSAPVAPSIVPGQLSVTSTPAGAQVQLDGQANPGWVTPYDLSGLAPGPHTLSIAKSGYATDTRTVEVGSGSKSFVSIQLSPLTATVSLGSDPAGAAIWMDGKDTGRLTPAQISVDKPGNHTFTLKKQGYLEESTSANLQIGQATHMSPTLHALGNTDDIKIGGKFKKLFGGGDTTGMGSVSIKTQPKGAQVAVNNRILDKTVPVDFFLSPGTYVIDITQTGFKSVHRVITVEKSGKIVIDETMDRQ